MARPRRSSTIAKNKCTMLLAAAYNIACLMLVCSLLVVKVVVARLFASTLNKYA